MESDQEMKDIERQKQLDHRILEVSFSYFWTGFAASVPLFLLWAYIYLNKKFHNHDFQLIAGACASQAFVYFNCFI